MKTSPQLRQDFPHRRSGAIDALRVVGIAAVVIGHVWENSVTSELFYPWHVPLFFFLTGYFWSFGRSFKVETENRFRTLGKPYLFWLAVLLVFWVVFNLSQSDFTMGDILRPLYGGFFATRPFSAFWFVTALFFAAVAFRAIERLHPALKYGLIGAGLFTAYIAGDLLAMVPLSMGMAWPCMVFIAMGTLFRRLERNVNAPLLVGSGLLAISAGLVWSGVSAPMRIKEGYFGTPVVSVMVAVAICSGLVLLTKTLFTGLPPVLHRAMTLLAKAGLVVVLVHALPLLIMGTTAAGGYADLVLAFVIPWALGLILLRTRLAPWATGIGTPQPHVSASA